MTIDRKAFADMYRTIEIAAEQYSDRADIMGGKGCFESIEEITEEGIEIKLEAWHCSCCGADTEHHTMPWEWIEDIKSRQPIIEAKAAEAAEKSRIAAKERAEAQAEAKRQSDLRQLAKLQAQYGDGAKS